MQNRILVCNFLRKSPGDESVKIVGKSTWLHVDRMICTGDSGISMWHKQRSYNNRLLHAASQEGDYFSRCSGTQNSHFCLFPTRPFTLKPAKIECKNSGLSHTPKKKKNMIFNIVRPHDHFSLAPLKELSSVWLHKGIQTEFMQELRQPRTGLKEQLVLASMHGCAVTHAVRMSWASLDQDPDPASHKVIVACDNCLEG